MIARIYQRKYKTNLIDVVEKLFSGDMKELVSTVLQTIVNPEMYFAKKIKYAIEKKEHKILIRILVSRSEVDMPQIKRCYQKLYNNKMSEDIRNKFSGDYGELLAAICKEE
jgi:hypothetical protein